MNFQAAVRSFLLVWLYRLIDAGEMLHYNIPGDQCGFIAEHGDQYSVTTSVEGDPPHYHADVDCTIGFRTDENERLFIRILRMDLEFSSQCTNDALLLYDGVTANDDKLMISHGYGICGDSLSLPNYYKSEGNEIAVRFVSNGADNEGRGFRLVVTPYKQAIGTGDDASCPTDRDYFMCLTDKKCMTKDAECNGDTQCSDGSDEPSNCMNRSTAGLHTANLLFLFLAVLGSIRVRIDCL